MKSAGNRGGWGFSVRLTLTIAAALGLVLGAFKPSRAVGRTGLVRDQVVFQQGQTANAESELQTGIELTKSGRFEEAIPHLLAARGHVADEYATNFDLALCYVGTHKFAEAAQILTGLSDGGHATAAVNDLLAQAYVGAGKTDKAFAAFQRAVQQTPEDEKLYVLVADACMEHAAYDLGMQVVDIGLKHLPSSAKLHYERGAFSARENQVDQASSEYEKAAKLAPGTDISYIASAQNDLLEGKIEDAIRVTRKGIQGGSDNYILLAIFGDAVARAGIAPGDRLFGEAEGALAKSIAERPDYEASQLALGELLLTAGRVDEAISHLERASELAPMDAAVYARLAVAYRRKGHTEEERRALGILAKINQQQAQKYKTDSPNKAGYVASAPANHKPSS